MFAAEYGRLELVRRLVPVEARMQTDGGATAMMYAAMAGNAECVRALAPHETNMLNASGEKALVYAAYYGHHDVAALLLDEAGAYNAYGEFALCYAIEMNWPLVVRVLLPSEGRMLTKHSPARDVRALVARWELDTSVFKAPEQRREQQDRHAQVRLIVEEFLIN